MTFLANSKTKMVRNIYYDDISYLVELPTEDSEYHLQLIRIQIGTTSFYSAKKQKKKTGCQDDCVLVGSMTFPSPVFTMMYIIVEYKIMSV
jgi:hypothetical protein